MDIAQAVKLSQDKIEADLFTRLVRRSIKRKERERQQAREDFREAFEVLLESQDKSTKTQDLMLEELRNLNRNIDDDEPVGRDRPDGRIRRPQEPDDITDSSTDEELSDEDYPQHHMRLPNLLYQGTRRGIVGAADLARRGLQGLYNRWNPQLAAELQGEQNTIRQEEGILQRRRQVQNSQQELLNKQEEVLQQEQQLQQQRQRLRDIQQNLEQQAQEQQEAINQHGQQLG